MKYIDYEFFNTKCTNNHVESANQNSITKNEFILLKEKKYLERKKLNRKAVKDLNFDLVNTAPRKLSLNSIIKTLNLYSNFFSY